MLYSHGHVKILTGLIINCMQVAVVAIWSPWQSSLNKYLPLCLISPPPLPNRLGIIILLLLNNNNILLLYYSAEYSEYYYIIINNNKYITITLFSLIFRILFNFRNIVQHCATNFCCDKDL